MGRQYQGMDRLGVQQVPEGSGEQGKMEKTGCKIICGAPTTLAVKGLMMMMMRKNLSCVLDLSDNTPKCLDMISLILCALSFSVVHALCQTPSLIIWPRPSNSTRFGYTTESSAPVH